MKDDLSFRVINEVIVFENFTLVERLQVVNIDLFCLEKSLLVVVNKWKKIKPYP